METEMVRVQLTYPPERVEEPVLYRLITDYGLVPDIRRANIARDAGGFMVLELRGEPDSLQSAMRYLDALGIEVSAVGMDGSDEWAY